MSTREPLRLFRLLPAVFQEVTAPDGSPAAGRSWLEVALEAFDEIFRQLEETIDGAHRVFDPDVTPAAFLEWAGGWLALSFREDLDEARRREFIRRAVSLYRLRGTRRGLQQMLEVHTGLHDAVEVDELLATFQIGVTSTIGVHTRFGGGEPHAFRVRLRLTTSDADRVRWYRQVATAVIDTEKPAHTRYELSVVTPSAIVDPRRALPPEPEPPNRSPGSGTAPSGSTESPGPGSGTTTSGSTGSPAPGSGTTTAGPTGSPAPGSGTATSGPTGSPAPGSGTTTSGTVPSGSMGSPAPGSGTTTAGSGTPAPGSAETPAPGSGTTVSGSTESPAPGSGTTTAGSTGSPPPETKETPPGPAESPHPDPSPGPAPIGSGPDPSPAPRGDDTIILRTPLPETTDERLPERGGRPVPPGPKQRPDGERTPPRRPKKLDLEEF